MDSIGQAVGRAVPKADTKNSTAAMGKYCLPARSSPNARGKSLGHFTAEATVAARASTSVGSTQLFSSTRHRQGLVRKSIADGKPSDRGLITTINIAHRSTATTCV